MKLTNTIEVTDTYYGSSKFPFWKELKKGDQIFISMVLANPGHNRDRVYTTDIYFRNKTTNLSFKCSLTQAENYLNKLNYTEKQVT